MVRSGRSRISPRRGRQLSGGAPTYDFAKFSRKLHEIERIWAPLRSATGSSKISKTYSKFWGHSAVSNGLFRFVLTMFGMHLLSWLNSCDLTWMLLLQILLTQYQTITLRVSIENSHKRNFLLQHRALLHRGLFCETQLI